MIGAPKHYRVWCDYHHNWEPDECYVTQSGNIIHNGRVANKDHTVEYYNGFKDKNGKQVCEGDIVLTDEAGWIAQVIFDGDSFLCVKKNSGYSMMCNWSDFEIIGNIHEHPEKLEGEVVYFGKLAIDKLRDLNLKDDHSVFKPQAKEE